MTALPLPASAPSAHVAQPHRRPRLTIRARPNSFWPRINSAELWRFRELLLSLTARDIKVRYKQTALGIAWVVLQPLVAAAIFAYVFGKLAKLPAPDTASGQHIPYFLFAFSGMVAWTLVLSIATKLSGILVGNSSLVSKVYFPRLLLPLSGALGLLVDLAVGAAMLLILQLSTGLGLTFHWFAAPILLVFFLTMALGIGMWAGALCVQYRDVAYILPVALQFLFFASPIGYSGQVGSSYGMFYYLNPLAALLDAWRWAVLSTPFPPLWAFAYSAAISIALLVIGAFVFRRMERTFADVI